MIRSTPPATLEAYAKSRPILNNLLVPLPCYPEAARN